MNNNPDNNANLNTTNNQINTSNNNGQVNQTQVQVTNTNVQQPVNNTPQVKPVKEKSLLGLIILLLLIILFALFLPEITKFVKDFLNNQSSTIVNDNPTSSVLTSSNLYNGLIKIGKDSYVTVDGIKASSFRKENNNIYYSLVSSTTKDLKGMYLQLYDNNQTLIYEYSFNNDTLKSNITSNKYLNVTTSVFTNSQYALISTSSKKNQTDATLTCKKTEELGTVSVLTTYTYTFSANNLNNYTYSKMLTPSAADEDYTESVLLIEEEYNKVVELNLENSDVTKYENALKYKIDLANNNIDSSSILHDKYETLKHVKEYETKKGYTCE